MKSYNYFNDIEFTIFVAEGTETSTHKMTANRIFNSGLEEGADFEFIYSLGDGYFEEVMKMKVGDSLAFDSHRDANYKSVIVRTF